MRSFILSLIYSHIQDSQLSSGTKPSSHLIALTSSICSDARGQVTCSTVKRAPSLTRARPEARGGTSSDAAFMLCLKERQWEKRRKDRVRVSKVKVLYMMSLDQYQWILFSQQANTWTHKHIMTCAENVWSQAIHISTDTQIRLI